ncbi:hypothetical protein [Natronorubrum tibetense]|nr:hypothetical protein [Natronorubrum tibetense]
MSRPIVESIDTESPTVPIAYCAACEWERRADEDSSTDLNRAMIDH